MSYIFYHNSEKNKHQASIPNSALLSLTPWTSGGGDVLASSFSSLDLQATSSEACRYPALLFAPNSLGTSNETLQQKGSYWTEVLTKGNCDKATARAPSSSTGKSG